MLRTPLRGSDRLAADPAPEPGHNGDYVQKGATVTIYRFGDVAATLTLHSTRVTDTGVRVVLSVKARREFTFGPHEFVWRDRDGTEQHPSDAPIDTDAVVRVRGRRTRTISLDFRRAGTGPIVWSPEPAVVAGVWVLTPDGESIGGRPHAVTYVQKGDTVTMFRGGDEVASLTLKSARFATYDNTSGQVVLSVKAKRRLTLTAGELIWEGEDGADRAPPESDKVVHAYGKHPRTLVIDYQNVGRGHIVWTPGNDIVAGVWTISAG